jgi:putative nucleotidyltransferase with HDIG domain
MNTDTHADELIDVQDLRLGMFVRLDGGWISHPFARNSFRITSDEQLAVIRTLGPRQVRWIPGLSDMPAVAPAAAGEPAAPPPAAPADTPRASALARQRAALAECERQFNEAAATVRQATQRVDGEPREAKAQFEALSADLLGRMLVEQDLCIRLLRDTAGNQATTHVLNVSIISLLLGRNFGMPKHELIDLGVGALLHDIGKLDVPDRLQHHDAQFTPAETRAFEEHVVLGLARGQKMGLPASVMQVIAQHHEMADGSGFPLRVGTERMSDAGRIVAMVNTYDGLCNPPVAARALTPHEALAHMFTVGKHRFDMTLLGSFIRMMGVYPAGSTVQLTDDRYAVVVSVHSSRPLKPRVLVHDAKVPRDEALVIDIGEHPGVGIRRSIKPQQLPGPVLQYLAPRQRVAYYFEPAHLAQAA